MCPSYSSLAETKRITGLLSSLVSLPPAADEARRTVEFTAVRDLPYFPIPFKETEVTAALKAIEGSLAHAILRLRDGDGQTTQTPPSRITVNLEKTTAFLFEAYLATVNGYGKLDPEVKKLLKGAFLRRIQPVEGLSL